MPSVTQQMCVDKKHDKGLKSNKELNHRRIFPPVVLRASEDYHYYDDDQT